MKKILVGIFVVLFSLPAMAVDVSGSVHENCGDSNTGTPMVGVTVYERGTTRGTTTDNQGRFMLRGVASDDSEIEFSFVGFASKTLLASELGGGVVVCLESTAEVIDDVIVAGTGGEDCGLNFLKSKPDNYIIELSSVARDQHKFILDGTFQTVEGTRICVPRTCMKGYKKSDDSRSCVSRNGDPCTRSELRTLSGEHARSGTYSFEFTGNWWEETGTEKCTNVTCDTNYEQNTDGTRCVPDCDVITEHDRSRGIKKKTLIDGQCYPFECYEPRYKLEGSGTSAQCVDQVGKDCTYTGDKAEGFDDRVKSTKYVSDGTAYGVKCVVKECHDPQFEPNDDGTDCEWGENTCSEQALGAIKFAKRGRWDAAQQKCIVKACKGSLKVDTAKNECICGSLPEGVSRQIVPTDTSLDTPHCEPTECIGERWELDGSGQNARCAEQECNIDHGQGKWVKDGDAYQCQVSKCDCGYVKSADSKSCIEKTTEEKVCTADTSPKLPKGAATATMTCDERNREYCKIGTCLDGYKHIESQNKCVSNCKCGQEWDDTKQKCRAKTAEEKNCTSEVANAKSATRACDGETEYCKVSKCNDGYELSENKRSCDAITGKDCKPKDKNARTGMRVYNQNTRKEWCKITACLGGYVVNDDGTKCEPTGKVKEAQEKYDLARESEQALENRMLGGLSMGAIGAGGLMLAQGVTEQAADKAAEEDMKAYLATFKCDYGAGRNIQGGKTNVELPGAAEMIPLYAEYVTLANDLKARKKQLGLKAGIESQKILDAATTGLYDDVGIGITSGAYASLARALLYPDGEDAKMWGDQQRKSKNLVIAGAATTGLGIVGSVAGYIASNKSYQDKVKAWESQKEKQLLENLRAELEALKLELANVNEMPECPNGSSGAYPDCDCGDLAFNPNTNECYACDNGTTLQTRDGAKGCYCPSNHYWDDSEGKCVALPQGCTPTCDPNSPNVRVLMDCSCDCANGYDYDEATQTCKCEGDNKLEEDGVCKTVTVVERFIQGANIVNTIRTSTQTDNVMLDSTALFRIGSSELLEEATGKLNEFLLGVTESGLTNCKIEIVGYTDPDGGPDHNYGLSVRRANAVGNYLNGKNSAIVEIKAIGKGEANCTCGLDTGELQIPAGKENDPDYSVCKGKKPYFVVPDGRRYAPCRRIEMSMKCEKVTTEEQRESTSGT